MNKYLLFGAAAFFLYMNAWGKKLGTTSEKALTDGSSSTDTSKRVDTQDIQILPAKQEIYLDEIDEPKYSILPYEEKSIIAGDQPVRTRSIDYV